MNFWLKFLTEILKICWKLFQQFFLSLIYLKNFWGESWNYVKLYQWFCLLSKHQEILYCRSNAETVSKIPEKKTKFENLKTSLKDALISKIPKAFFNVGPIPIHTWLFPGNIQTYFRYAISFYLKMLDYTNIFL